MASSETSDQVNDLSKKIDAAFDLCYKNKVDAGIDGDNKRNFSSFKEMYDEFHAKKSTVPNTFFVDDELIFNKNCHVRKSRILSSKKLIEALVFSKLYQHSEYAENRDKHEGELVLVSKDNEAEVYLVLVSENRIIYTVLATSVTLIRIIIRKFWPIMKERHKNNLIDSFGTTEPTPDWSKCATSVPSSLDAAARSNIKSNKDNDWYTLTDEIKKIMTDEVNKLNLDPLVKEQFLFDLQVIPHKDVFYWRDRVDCLRLFSYRAAAISPEQAPVQVAEEKSNEKLQQLLEKISNLQETVNKLLEQRVNGGSSGTVHEEFLLEPQEKTGLESSPTQMHFNQQEGSSEKLSNESLGILMSSVQALDDKMKKIEDNLEEFLNKIETNSESEEDSSDSCMFS